MQSRTQRPPPTPTPPTPTPHTNTTSPTHPLPVQPAEWKRMLTEGQQSGKMPLVLDVRNSYEWDAGHFVGAERPLEVGD